MANINLETARSSERLAFARYLRTGRTQPARDGRGQGAATRYVWVTESDSKVRASHRANDGKIFSWNSPPATGHPGDDFNCRCTAIPFVSGETEFASHVIVADLVASGDRWTNLDFIRHYYYGKGASINLATIGHLREIIGQYAYMDAGDGAFRRLSNEIASESRKNPDQDIAGTYDNNYDFSSVAYSHGNSQVYGNYSGQCTVRDDMIVVAAQFSFFFNDQFVDPLSTSEQVDIDTETGTPYVIFGRWATSFTGAFFLNAQASRYVGVNA